MHLWGILKTTIFVKKKREKKEKNKSALSGSNLRFKMPFHLSCDGDSTGSSIVSTTSTLALGVRTGREINQCNHKHHFTCRPSNIVNRKSTLYIQAFKHCQQAIYTLYIQAFKHRQHVINTLHPGLQTSSTGKIHSTSRPSNIINRQNTLYIQALKQCQQAIHTLHLGPQPDVNRQYTNKTTTVQIPTVLCSVSCLMYAFCIAQLSGFVSLCYVAQAYESICNKMWISTPWDQEGYCLSLCACSINAWKIPLKEPYHKESSHAIYCNVRLSPTRKLFTLEAYMYMY